MKVTDTTVMAELHRTLTRVSQGTALIASNLANVDTPGYRAQRLTFAETLGQTRLEMARTSGGHRGAASSGKPGTVTEAPGHRMRADGNTVDVDREMTELARLTGRFNTSAQMVRKHLALLRYAATDGRQ